SRASPVSPRWLPPPIPTSRSSTRRATITTRRRRRTIRAGERRRARFAQDPPGFARGAAQPQAAGEDAHAAPGQPAVDHAGHGERVEVHRQAHLKNDSLLKALALQPTPHTPIWLMRQAGRYLPE